MSSATVRVEKATSDLLIGPDWTMNIDICDSINSDHWQAKEVVKAVKKRLQNKNPKVQLLALTLLETMIKNCGDYVHHQVAERNILPEMIKIVKKKSDMHVRDKILVLLDSWQEAFGGPGGKFPQYYWAYDELRHSGVEFPQRSANSAPIFTPPATHPTARHSQAGYGMPSNTARRLDEAMASEMANLSLSNLDSMKSVMELLNDMLQAMNPNDCEAIKDEVIVDLVSQCRSNQKKLMQLVNSTGLMRFNEDMLGDFGREEKGDEQLLGQGLQLNDYIQSLLAKHDAIASGSPLPAETNSSGHCPTASAVGVADPPLRETVSSGPGGNALVTSSAVVSERIEDEEEEDDDFAQLARRRSKARPVLSEGMCDGTVSVVATTSATSASSAPIESNALAVHDPPNTVQTTTKEQDMIDLLSLTLYTSGSSPHTPSTPPTNIPQTPSLASNYNQIEPVAPNSQGYTYAPQPYPMNQGQVPYSYVVPWAQSPAQAQPQFQPQSQVPKNSYGYPPPPWASGTNDQCRPPTSSSPYSCQGAETNTTSSCASGALQQHNSFGSRGNNFPVSQGSPSAGRPLQHYNSFGSRAHDCPASSLKEAQVSPTVGHGAPTTGNKPFVPSYRLFEDLIDLRSSGVKSNGLSQTSSLSGSAGQGMVGRRK